MIVNLLGFIISTIVVVGTVFVMAKNKAIYISLEGIVIVIGGTISVAMSAFPASQLKQTLKSILAIFRNHRDESAGIVTEIIELSKKTKGERLSLQRELANINNPFLRDGTQLIIDRVDHRLEDILVEKIKSSHESEQAVIAGVKTLAKFPPALGLLATVLSLVTLLEGLGNAQTGMSSLGPSMAVGLVGTLYGIVMANLFLSPIAENLALKSSHNLRLRQIILQGLILIKAQETPLVVQESLNAMLADGQRVDLLGVDRSGGET